MMLALLLLFTVATLFYGLVCFAVALALFIFTPAFVHPYEEWLRTTRARKDAMGRLTLILSTGAVTNEKLVVVMMRILFAIFVVLGALVMAHAIGLKTGIFD